MLPTGVPVCLSPQCSRTGVKRAVEETVNITQRARPERQRRGPPTAFHVRFPPPPSSPVPQMADGFEVEYDLFCTAAANAIPAVYHSTTVQCLGCHRMNHGLKPLGARWHTRPGHQQAGRQRRASAEPMEYYYAAYRTGGRRVFRGQGLRALPMNEQISRRPVCSPHNTYLHNPCACRWADA
ncbi:hypothetical protein NDU88_005234 [Pleurodeles waltl]|uniref:Uncharacterized protein n=1 Tax=Pleurodeles waltl TaxID=8319 RepID=A0AAV7L044_PLEWA|nr:hypothetical protein NDU88_005234 [Pleurodeles waltl]